MLERSKSVVTSILTLFLLQDRTSLVIAAADEDNAPIYDCMYNLTVSHNIYRLITRNIIVQELLFLGFNLVF